MAATITSAKVTVVRRRKRKIDPKSEILYGDPVRGVAKSGRQWKQVETEYVRHDEHTMCYMCVLCG